MKILLFCLLVTSLAVALPKKGEAQSQATRSNSNIPRVTPPPPPPPPPAAGTGGNSAQQQDAKATGGDKPPTERELQTQKEKEQEAQNKWEEEHPVQSFVNAVSRAIKNAVTKLSASKTSAPTNSSSVIGVRG